LFDKKIKGCVIMKKSSAGQHSADVIKSVWRQSENKTNVRIKKKDKK
jgi:hypothetical protein